MDLPLERGGTHAFLQQLFIEHLLATVKLCAGAWDTWEIKGMPSRRRQVSNQAEDGHLGGYAKRKVAQG